jgi:ribose/xylose/arabinose/galactoside ABC-type transport system permease subunit
MTIRTQPVSRINVFALLVQFRELALVAFIMALILVISLSSPNFATFTNFMDILLDISILAMVAMGQAVFVNPKGDHLTVEKGTTWASRLEL